MNPPAVSVEPSVSNSPSRLGKQTAQCVARSRFLYDCLSRYLCPASRLLSHSSGTTLFPRIVSPRSLMASLLQQASGAELSAAWSTLSSGLVPASALGLVRPGSDSSAAAGPSSPEALRQAVEVLCGWGLEGCVEEWYLEVLQTDLQRSVVPEFWSGLEQPENGLNERQRAGLLLSAFRTLRGRLEPYLRGLALLGGWEEAGTLPGLGAEALREKVFTLLRAILLFSPGPALGDSVQEFYARTFRVHMKLRRERERDRGGREQDSLMEETLGSSSIATEEVSEEEEEEEEGGSAGLCPGCRVDRGQCWCLEAMEQLEHLRQILTSLHLLERVSSDAVTTILHKLIEQRMEARCRGEYERSFLNDFQEWLEKVNGWLSKVFLSQTQSLEGDATLKRWRCHMHSFFYLIYVSMRIEELFSIIRDFPDSKPAIEDLKYCLERTGQRQQLLTSLKAAMETRLLHPGVHTSDIITLYISAIMALRELDPSMVILQVACEPIRKYLRTREDTVRQIVAGLTGDTEGSSELANELSKADPVTLEHGQDSDEETAGPEEWLPDPIDAEADKCGSKRRSSDIISLLVSIYGSKELFISEYRSVLADRLIHQLSYNTAREIRNVELLKLRFGESHLHFCEVMLKDVADSRRINSNVADEEMKLPEEQRSPLPLSALIMSSEFWPPLKEEKLELPAPIKEVMESFTKRYEKLKAMRTLSWKPHLGSVTLDLELGDRTLSNLSVSPVHAAIIMHFQDRSSWTLEELGEALEMPTSVLRRRMTLWQQQGVLREEPAGTFVVVEKAQCERPEKNVVLLESDEEGESNMATQSEQKEEKLQMFWAYIQAMLTNLDSMSLERIHNMLKMFVTMGPVVTEMDIQELQAFLQTKVRDQQLLSSGGVYRLPKSPN
ncbi:anaphase-promoting complex subunit 2 [Acipenser ruthenus]|uniref:anaphase-promoting complex subunit 2 n=1 Tax=Acipenser ruthenus TaxID=7906 RepID=UPI00274159EF|nr:anaphase-promoting complex subunit 2 [Acipenser ruthenus]